MSREILGASGSTDPDDLALFLAASLKQSGVPDVSIRLSANEAGELIAIEVWSRKARVASFDCHPIKVGPSFEAVLNAAAKIRGNVKP